MRAKWLWACLLGTVVGIASAPLDAEVVFVDSEQGNDAHSGGPGQPVPDADLYVAPNGGHGHHTDQIEAFGPILLRFLNRAHGQRKGDQL